MQMERRKRFIVNVSFWAIILALVFLVFKYLLGLIMPFFLALIFAAVMRPLAVWLARDYRRDKTGKPVGRRLHLTKGVAGLVSVVLLFLVLAGLVALVLVRLISSAADVIAAVPAFYTGSVEPYLAEYLGRIEDLAQQVDPSLVETVEQMVPEILSAVGSAVTNFSVNAVSAISSLVTRLPSFLLGAVICVIASVFISVGFDDIQSFLGRQFPAHTVEVFRSVRDSLRTVIFQYGRSYLLIMAITFAEITLGLLLIGVHRAPLIGALIALFDIFPIVGAGMILLPWAIITLLQGRILRGVCLGLLYVVVIVVRQIMEPKIVGRHVGLPPIVTLLTMYVGSKLFGAVGLLGLPILSAILVNLDATGVLPLFRHRQEPPAEQQETDAAP